MAIVCRGSSSRSMSATSTRTVREGFREHPRDLRIGIALGDRLAVDESPVPRLAVAQAVMPVLRCDFGVLTRHFAAAEPQVVGLAPPYRERHFVEGDDPLAEQVANLEAGWDRAVELVGANRARVWRLYMAASAIGFEDAGISVHQVLGVVPTRAGDSGMPLTRDRWHATT